MHRDSIKSSPASDYYGGGKGLQRGGEGGQRAGACEANESGLPNEKLSLPPPRLCPYRLRHFVGKNCGELVRNERGERGRFLFFIFL